MEQWHFGCCGSIATDESTGYKIKQFPKCYENNGCLHSFAPVHSSLANLCAISVIDHCSNLLSNKICDRCSCEYIWFVYGILWLIISEELATFHRTSAIKSEL